MYRILIKALFIMVNILKKHKCPAIGKRFNKLGLPLEYYAAIQNHILEEYDDTKKCSLSTKKKVVYKTYYGMNPTFRKYISYIYKSREKIGNP